MSLILDKTRLRFASSPPLPRPNPRLCRAIAALALITLLCSSACSPEGVARSAQGESRVDADRPLPPPTADALFTEVTLPAGLTVEHRLPTPDLANIIDATGAGAAWADLDGDGWLDLIVLGGARSPEADGVHSGLRIYRNRQDGRFEDVTGTSGIPPQSTGVAVGLADVDGDGDRDLYLVDRGPNRLYLNRGDGTFEDGTRRAGVDDAGFGVGAVFFDLEGDGDLDLYVANYLQYDPRETSYYEPDGFPGPMTYEPQADALYRNRGDGSFEDVSEASGVASLTAGGRGMSLVAADFDDDRDVDVFVANDATANFLLANDGSGRFSEEALPWGLALGENGEQTSAMSADVGDVNGDGQLDVVVSDTAFGALYIRMRPGFYLDDVMSSGLGLLSGQYASWGQNLLDFDNDGDLDLFLVNSDLHHLVGWEDSLLRNDGDGRFADASPDAGPYFRDRRVGRGSVVGDYDNDGDLDLFVTGLGSAPALLRNNHDGRASWITLDLIGRAVRDPFGARVHLEAGGRSFVAESRCRSVYLGQSEPRLHFGLGRGVEVIDRIEVLWPDGTETVLTDVPARQILPVEQGVG